MFAFQQLTKRDKRRILKNVKKLKAIEDKPMAKDIFNRHKWTYLGSLVIVVLGVVTVLLSPAIASLQFCVGAILIGFGSGVLSRDMNLSIRATRVLPFLLKLIDADKLESLIDQYDAQPKKLSEKQNTKK